MDVVIAHPPGYGLMAEPFEVAAGCAAAPVARSRSTDSMAEAFDGADVVCAKSWAPLAAMEERAALHDGGDADGIRRWSSDCSGQMPSTATGPSRPT